MILERIMGSGEEKNEDTLSQADRGMSLFSMFYEYYMVTLLKESSKKKINWKYLSPFKNENSSPLVEHKTIQYLAID